MWLRILIIFKNGEQLRTSIKKMEEIETEAKRKGYGVEFIREVHFGK